ncbi:MAG: DeoR/GlpR family DNA-binding transcription regulator [Oscillospiraceae bacterium]|jgi:DeoR family fructose operon transcriptional repressor|nr:DeoR/GlpR family DNA-binding transcription regulator [Oscillospiraceae bacterium]
MQPPERTLFTEGRRERILALLDAQANLRVAELCQRFGVSAATIRSDLRALARSGRLHRTHGGAMTLFKAGFEPTPQIKQGHHLTEKQRIAKFAATLVEEGDTVALDAGSTTMELARALCERKGLTVVTYDVEIATYLDARSDAAVYLAGGQLRKGFNMATGAMTVSAIRSLNVDIAFLGANAFSMEKGFTTPKSELVEVKQALIAIANRSVALVDSGKLGRASFLKFADPRDVDMLVTDSGVPGKMADAIREGGLSLRVV